MELEDLQKVVLDYLTRLASLSGDYVLRYYSDIVESLEEQNQMKPLEKSRAERITLWLLYQKAPHFNLDAFCKADDKEGFERSLQQDWESLPHKIVEANVHLVKQVASTYHQIAAIDNEQKFNDLLSAGHEALTIAAEKYFKNPKGDFKSFAWDIMKVKVQEEQSRHHPVPYKVRKKIRKLQDLREDWSLKQKDLTEKDIVERLSIDPKELPELLHLEAIWGNGLDFEQDIALEDLEEPDNDLDSLAILLQIENQQIVEEAMDSLDIREKQIIQEIYFAEKKFREVVDRMEISMSVGKKLHKRALQKMLSFVDELK